MANLLAVALVEDNPGDARLIQEMLRQASVARFRVVCLSRLDELLAHLERESFAVLLLDLGLPDSQGLATFHSVQRRAPRMPIIIISGADDEELAVDAVARGAQDYLVKGQMDAFLLKRAIRYAIERKRGESEIQKLNDELERRVTQRTAQLERANKELEAFSYSVSHDLRAPLRSIDGFSQALLEDCAGRLDDQGREYLKYIRESAQRMAQLIDDLLGLSRVTRAELQRVQVDISMLARTVVERLKACDKPRAVTCAIQDNLWASGDARLLRAALENLIGNAWKFTSKQRTAHIECGALVDRQPVVYFVRDNGAGFDMAYAGKLFGVFQRLHSPEEFEGTGIGLATVQRIVRRHGGRVWAEGEVGRGASFYFTLAEENSNA